MRLLQHVLPASTLKGITIGIAAIGASGLSLFAGDPARAQLLNQLQKSVGSGQGSAGNALGGLGGGLPSVDRASPTNLAGVLQYCVRNNYLSGGAASSVKESLLSKGTESDGGAKSSQFKEGNSGMLETGQGQNFSLGGSGIKAQMTNKVCDLVLQHAKSML
jgi:Protein of unknown function (DUF2501)